MSCRESCSLEILLFSIFGFASLFSVLPQYGIYESRCQIVSEKIVSNDTKTITKDCRGQIDEYQVGKRKEDDECDQSLTVVACVCIGNWILQSTSRCSGNDRRFLRTAIPENHRNVKLRFLFERNIPFVFSLVSFI